MGYPNTRDLEQLYDLERDPNQKENIFNNAPQMMVHSELISKFETLMRIYIDKHCLSVNQFIPCEQPELRFGSASGLYDIPTTTNNGGGGGGGGGHGTPAPSHDSSDPCAG